MVICTGHIRVRGRQWETWFEGRRPQSANCADEQLVCETVSLALTAQGDQVNVAAVTDMLCLAMCAACLVPHMCCIACYGTKDAARRQAVTSILASHDSRVYSSTQQPCTEG